MSLPSKLLRNDALLLPVSEAKPRSARRSRETFRICCSSLAMVVGRQGVSLIRSRTERCLPGTRPPEWKIPQPDKTGSLPAHARIGERW